MKKLLIIISLFMTCIFGFANAKPLDVDVTEGAKLPNFELRDFHGKYTKSKKLFGDGKPTLLIFAAEWCPYCQRELADVQKFYEENKDNINVVVVFTRRKTNLSATKKYVEDSKFTFPVYYDTTNTLMTAFKVKTVPYNLIVQNSRIQKDLGGSKNYEELKEAFYLNY